MVPFPMLLIYTHRVTDRVKYTFGLIFNSILGITFEITTDKEYFKKFEGAKLSYGEKFGVNEVFYHAAPFLYSTELKKPGLVITKNLEEKILFIISDTDMVFDPFAASFYLVSRYEEYLTAPSDVHGRFSSGQSLAGKHGFLDKPVVDLWAEGIKKNILEKYPFFKFPERKYSYTPTIDIDNAYAYRGKNMTRTLGGYLKAIAKGNGEDFKKRKNVLDGKEKDPFDTYELQFELHEKYDLKPIYFFLLADWAPNDKNLPHDSPLMRSLIKDIAEKADIGIHPSFASNQNPEKVKVEEKRLREITGKKTTKSRQHFLMLKFPNTYRDLLAAGITDDYTMGYADETGFRAGICTPFKWYDLEKEQETTLTIHPFAVMDGTLNGYLKLSPEQAVEKIKEVVKEVKNVNGVFITVWHNETLSDWREWKGWKDVYRKMIQAAT